MGQFRQCLSELSDRDTIMAGYYSLTVLFKYMNGSFFLKSKYMNGVGFQILA